MFVESGGNSLAEGDKALRKLFDMYAYVRKAACDWCIRVSKCNLEYPIGGRTARQKTQSAKMQLSLFHYYLCGGSFTAEAPPLSISTQYYGTKIPSSTLRVGLLYSFISSNS